MAPAEKLNIRFESYLLLNEAALYSCIYMYMYMHLQLFSRQFIFVHKSFILFVFMTCIRNVFQTAHTHIHICIHRSRSTYFKLYDLNIEISSSSLSLSP